MASDRRVESKLMTLHSKRSIFEGPKNEGFDDPVNPRAPPAALSATLARNCFEEVFI